MLKTAQRCKLEKKIWTTLKSKKYIPAQHWNTREDANNNTTYVLSDVAGDLVLDIGKSISALKLPFG